MTERNVGIDHNERVYVIAREGEGPEVLPFAKVEDRIFACSHQLFQDPPPIRPGSREAYDLMVVLLDALRAAYERTGEPASCDLSPMLIGLEGQHVRAVTMSMDERDFVVGVTEGFLPHHVELRDGGVHRAELHYQRVRPL